MSENKKNINRRDFFKYLGGGTAAAFTMASCKPANSPVSTVSEVPKGKLETRICEPSGDKVSLLGYGGMRWPVLKEPAPNGNIIDQQGVNDLIDYCMEYGVNYFDTSPAYMQGWSEHTLGVSLSRFPRDKYFIATKMSNFNPTLWNFESSKKMYQDSFKHLQVDYIDYMLLHAVGNGGWDAFMGRFIDNGILDYLVEERAAGRIKNLGFSFHGEIEVYEYLLNLHDKVHWDFVQIQVNYVDWDYANQRRKNNQNGRYLYEELEKRNISAIIMEPVLGGRLTRMPEYLAAKLLELRPDKTMAWWAFRYAGTFPKVLTVLSGMTYLEHLQENITTYSPLEPITPEENELLMEIARLMMEFPVIDCTACQYCMPCPYGVDIPAIFTHYNKCVIDGLYPESQQDENYKKGRKAFLVGYDRSVPKLRQAAHCINCKECVVHCPQKVNIPVEMRKVNSYIEALKQNTL